MLRLTIFALASTFFSSCLAENAPLVEEAWQDASRLLISEAKDKFDILSKGRIGDPREAAFGKAVTLLNIQPKTPSNIERASQQFRDLCRENADDEYGILSSYYLARIEQIHRYEPNWPEAARIYLNLYRSHPEHAIAQIAVVKYSIVRLFDDVPPVESASRLQEIETLAEKIFYQPAVRDIHLTLADYYTKISPSRDSALKHLLAANAAGIARTKFQGDIWLRIADLAAASGQPKMAIEFYERFAGTFQRDDRTFTVEQRLAKLRREIPK